MTKDEKIKIMITLETAKKLHKVAKEKGIKLPYKYHDYHNNSLRCTHCGISIKEHYNSGENYCPKKNKRYTTDELLDLLPDNTILASKVKAKRLNGGYISSHKNTRIYADTPAEALGQLVTELIKKGIIK